MIVEGVDIIYALSLSFLSISLILLCITLILHCKKKPPIKKEQHSSSEIKTSAKSVPFSDIDEATDGFNPRKVIGKGRIGTTYVGILAKGELIAVKRVHPWLVLSKPGLGFQSMIKSLSLAQHSNIVPIMGFSEAPCERIIFMEFMGTMSLEFYLHQNVDSPSLLDWPKRLKIAVGVAHGLEYLHEKMAPQVVHGCIKPSNILVDVKFCAKLCDYGLSFLALKQEKMGLLGYVDEEYWHEKGGACKECDVYGFGVVLLELLSGRTNEGGLLVEWMLPLIKEMKFCEFLDQRIKTPCNMKVVAKLAKVASTCVSNSRKTRPKITQIVSILDSLDFDLIL
ncbi:serine/threonine-protein kinase-like protein ACR4 [Silene latifolia]|uniref:serine/threonine-protein kinase-like protein ACR4 n=1 Tax=Silene latifolia TaxID=37657 RepID=UPI003D77ECF6